MTTQDTLLLSDRGEERDTLKRELQLKATVFVGADGLLKFIYRDELVELLALGASAIKRASHVEPSPIGAGWIADLEPSDGPIIGPFPLRRLALDAEVNWLERMMG